MNISEQFERHFHPDQFKGSEPRPVPAEPEPEHDLAWESEMQAEWQMGCDSPMVEQMLIQQADSGVAS